MPVPGGEAEAYTLLERLRWPDAAPACPLCGAVGTSYYLRPVDGRTRATRTGRPTQRRVWKCGSCRGQFSALAGTILHGTRISLCTWIAIIGDWAAAGRPPAASDLVQRHGMSRAAARRISQRLELAARSCRVPAAAAAATQHDDVAAADRLLSALLRMPAEDAARIRERTPSRVRPRPQCGPSADYGTR